MTRLQAQCQASMAPGSALPALATPTKTSTTTTTVLLTNAKLFSLHVGWLFACIQYHRPSFLSPTNSWIPRNRPAYKKLTFYYVFAALLYQLLSFLYFALWPPKSGLRSSQGIGTGLSDILIHGIVAWTFSVLDLVRRVYFLTCPNVMLDFFRKLNQLDRKMQNYWNRKWDRGIDQNGNLLDPKLMGFSRWVLYATCFSFALAITRSGSFFIVETTLQFRHVENSNQQLIFIKEAAIRFLKEFYALASKLFANGLIILFGLNLIQMYHEFVTELQLSIYQQPRQGQLEGKGVGDKDGNQAEEEAKWTQLSQIWSTLQQTLSSYNRLVGFLLIVKVLQNSVLGVFYMWKAMEIVSEGQGTGFVYKLLWFVSGTVDELVNLYLAGYVGQTFTDKMKEAREEIGRTLTKNRLGISVGIFHSRSRLSPSMIANVDEEGRSEIVLANHVMEWKWKLTACGLFDINYKLFSMVAGTAMTYVMFMFQLRLAEHTSTTSSTSTNGSNNNMNTNTRARSSKG